ncbi:unnamed protein product [Symbiodinium sp. CCMP2592]|nr:unnamed protein product [Symbiodinium sp. CCMP2592]
MQHIISPDVPLTVLENIVLLPSLLRAPPMAHLQLQLKVLRGPRRPLEEFPSVALPVPHFSFHVQAVEGGPDILYVQPQMGRVVTQRLGSGRVLAVDSRIENNTAASIVHVADPAVLRFATLPLWRGPGVPIDARAPGWLGTLEGGWEDAELQVLRADTAGVSSAEPKLQLVQGRTYALKLELMDGLSQPMQIPLNLRAEARCVAEPDMPPALQLVHQASNSAVIIFRAVELGEGIITIDGLALQADSEDQARGLKTLPLKLTAKQVFHVAPELRPLVPVPGPMLLPRWHSYLLKVAGGSGQQAFALTQLNPAGVASVSAEGHVQVFGRLGSAELRVYDTRNPENNFTLPVLVRRAGHLRLLPRYLQIRLSPDHPTEEVVRVQARPEEGGDDAELCRLLRNLTFWNCTVLFPSDQLVPEVSNNTVASVLAASSGEFATCAALHVRPLAAGRFQLIAKAQEVDAPALPSASLPFEVYKPLKWQLLGVPSPADVLAAAQTNQTAALVVAPCSSVRLCIVDGPLGLTVQGRETWNLTAGAHISVQRLSHRCFEVACLQVTPGPVRLVGEVSHTPVDPAHGQTFVDRLALWLRCSVPARVQAVAELHPDDLPDVDKDRGEALGVQRGRETAFRAKFIDAFGRTILNASEYWLRWSLVPTGSRDGVPFQKAWLSTGKELSLASLAVPRDATVGATARLKLEVSLPPSSLCASAATLAALPLPSGDDLGLAVARKLELRWPGHPEKPRFAIFKNLTIVLEAGFGTGRARLEVSPGQEILEVVEARQICGDVPDGQPCVPALWIGSPCNVTKAAVQRWFLKPVAQGTASLRLWDPDLLGARPQRLEMAIRAAKQLDVGLLGEDASDGTTVLVVRGVLRQLRVDIRDAEGEALGMVNWAALDLKLRSSDPGAFEVRESTVATRCGQYECICHTPGIYRLSAEMQDYPSGTIYSRVLHVHCLPEFDVVLKNIVVMPGQAFELAFTGGPPRSDDRTFFHFTSSAPDIASIDEGVGLVIALSPGSADLSVQLLERETRREIARAGAHVTVGIPWNASIGALDTLAGQADAGSDKGMVLRWGGPEPLRLRARLWSGELELTPLLLGMASAQASPSFSAESSRKVYKAALDMGNPVVEAVEAAAVVAQRVAVDEGLGLASDAAGAGAAFGVRCRFRWSSDSSVVLEPVGLGALAVDVRMAPASATAAGEEVQVAVQIDCPLGSGYEQLHLQAKRLFPVVQPLQLLTPITGVCAAAVDASSLLVPSHARLPLAFNLPRSHLQVDVAVGRTIQLLETGDVVELETGSELGESTLLVQAIDPQLHVPAVQISVFVRKAFAARIDSVPSRLPIGSSALCPLYLVDANGQTMALPSNFQVDVFSSHTALMSEVHRSSKGTSLYLRPLSEGCTLVSAAVRMPDGRRLPSDVAEICVVRGALVGQGQLLLQPGSRLNLDAEELFTGKASAGRPPLAFSVRLAQLGSRSLEDTAARLAAEVAAVLSSGLLGSPGPGAGHPLQVRMVGARWSVKQEQGELQLGAEVDLQVSARELAEVAGRSAELGLRDLAEVLWTYQDVQPNESLRLLDFAWGVRAIAEEPASSSRCGGCCVKSHCRSCCGEDSTCGHLFTPDATGWHSLQPRTVKVEGPRVTALALEPGVATLRYCDGIVTADIQVTVAHARQLTVRSAPEGGPSPALVARKIVSNEANSAPMQAKFRAFREGSSEAEEFLSDPFLAQNFHLQCNPTEAAMREFFSFKAVGDACVLTAREPSVTALQRLSPSRLGLVASLPGSVGGGVVLEWPFAPQFRIVQESQLLESGEVCATLSTSQPESTVIVWTGGHSVQADLDQIPSSLGNVSVEVGPSHKGPFVDLRLMWHGAVEWGVSEEVQLVVWSPETSQASNCRVRVEPTKKVHCAQHDGRSAFELCLLAAVAAMIWFLARSCSRPSPSDGSPGSGLGAAFQGVGAGPVFSGDPFGGPRAVSPFQALGRELSSWHRTIVSPVTLSDLQAETPRPCSEHANRRQRTKWTDFLPKLAASRSMRLWRVGFTCDCVARVHPTPIQG